MTHIMINESKLVDTQNELNSGENVASHMETASPPRQKTINQSLTSKANALLLNDSQNYDSEDKSPQISLDTVVNLPKQIMQYVGEESPQDIVRDYSKRAKNDQKSDDSSFEHHQKDRSSPQRRQDEKQSTQIDCNTQKNLRNFESPLLLSSPQESHYTQNQLSTEKSLLKDLATPQNINNSDGKDEEIKKGSDLQQFEGEKYQIESPSEFQGGEKLEQNSPNTIQSTFQSESQPTTHCEDTQVAIVPEKLFEKVKSSENSQIILEQDVQKILESETEEISRKPLCDQHLKPIEAFCEFDRQLLCIDCILSNEHRGQNNEVHDLLSLEQAQAKESQALQEACSLSEQLLDTLKEQNQRLKKHMESMKTNLDDIFKENEVFFEEIRQIIDKRQQEITQNYTQLYESEINLLQAKMDENQQRIDQMAKYREEWIKSRNLNKIQILQESKQRRHQIDKSLEKVVRLNLNQKKLVEFRRDQEIATITKRIQKCNANYSSSKQRSLTQKTSFMSGDLQVQNTKSSSTVTQNTNQKLNHSDQKAQEKHGIKTQKTTSTTNSINLNSNHSTGQTTSMTGADLHKSKRLNQSFSRQNYATTTTASKGATTKTSSTRQSFAQNSSRTSLSKVANRTTAGGEKQADQQSESQQVQQKYLRPTASSRIRESSLNKRQSTSVSQQDQQPSASEAKQRQNQWRSSVKVQPLPPSISLLETSQMNNKESNTISSSTKPPIGIHLQSPPQPLQTSKANSITPSQQSLKTSSRLMIPPRPQTMDQTMQIQSSQTTNLTQQSGSNTSRDPRERYSREKKSLSITQKVPQDQPKNDLKRSRQSIAQPDTHQASEKSEIGKNLHMLRKDQGFLGRNSVPVNSSSSTSNHPPKSVNQNQGQMKKQKLNIARPRGSTGGITTPNDRKQLQRESSKIVQNNRLPGSIHTPHLIQSGNSSSRDPSIHKLTDDSVKDDHPINKLSDVVTGSQSDRQTDQQTMLQRLKQHPPTQTLAQMREQKKNEKLNNYDQSALLAKSKTLKSIQEQQDCLDSILTQIRHDAFQAKQIGIVQEQEFIDSNAEADSRQRNGDDLGVDLKQKRQSSANKRSQLLAKLKIQLSNQDEPKTKKVMNKANSVSNLKKSNPGLINQNSKREVDQNSAEQIYKQKSSVVHGKGFSGIPKRILFNSQTESGGQKSMRTLGTSQSDAQLLVQKDKFVLKRQNFIEASQIGAQNSQITLTNKRYSHKQWPQIKANESLLLEETAFNPVQEVPLPEKQTFETDLMSLYYKQKALKKQYLYVISGFCESTLASVERFDLVTKKWETIQSALNVPRTKFAAIVLNQENPALQSQQLQTVSNFEGNQAQNSLQLPTSQNNTNTASQRKILLVLGGKNREAKRTSSVEMYDFVECRWSMAKQFEMTRPKSGFACVLVTTNVEQGLVVGGTLSSSPRPNFGQSPSPLKSAQSCGGTSSILNNNNNSLTPKLLQKLFLIGGNDGRVLNQVEVLDFAEGRWSSLPVKPMRHRRDELAACLGPDNQIYAVGGYGGGDNNCLGSAERCDPLGGEWELIASLQQARRALSLVAMPDGVYAIGGFSGTDYISSVERYDISQNVWQPIASMLSPKCTLSCVVSQPDFRYIYAIGGFNGQPLASIERYDVTKEKWEKLDEQMARPRFMHTAIFINQ